MNIKRSFLCFIFLLLFSVFANTSVVNASLKKNPDKVETIEVNLEETLDMAEIDCAYYEKCAKVWDFSKDIKVTYGNVIYSAYLSHDGAKSWIHQVTQVKPKTLTSLEFPDKILDAPVTKLGSSKHILVFGDLCCNIFGYHTEPYHDEENGTDYYVNEENVEQVLSSKVTSVTIPSSVTELEEACFHSFYQLKKIVLPDQLFNIPYCSFYYCVNLGEIVFPANLQDITPNAFRKCKNLNKISISKSSKNYTCKNGLLLSKNGKTLVWVAPKIQKLTIPNGIKTIASNATTYSYVTNISIPKSVTSIKDCAFNGDFIKNITIASSNPRYGKSGNCIYSKKTHRLVVVISSKETVTLPKQVYYLKDNLSIAGKPISEIVIPSTFKKFYDEWYTNPKCNSPTLVFKSKTPPASEPKGLVMFGTIYVPKGCTNTYKNWSLKVTKGIEYEEYYVPDIYESSKK